MRFDEVFLLTILMFCDSEALQKLPLGLMRVKLQKRPHIISMKF